MQTLVPNSHRIDYVPPFKAPACISLSSPHSQTHRNLVGKPLDLLWVHPTTLHLPIFIPDRSSKTMFVTPKNRQKEPRSSLSWLADSGRTLHLGSFCLLKLTLPRAKLVGYALDPPRSRAWLGSGHKLHSWGSCVMPLVGGHAGV